MSPKGSILELNMVNVKIRVVIPQEAFKYIIVHNVIYHISTHIKSF